MSAGSADGAPRAPVTISTLVRAGLAEGAVLVVGGVLVGTVGGLWSLTEQGVQAIAHTGARPFVALLFVLPGLLLLLNFAPARLDLFATAGGGLLVGLVAGGGGGLVGALAYFVPAGNLPTITRGTNAGAVYDALRGEVGLSRFVLVVGVTTVAGLAAGLLTSYRVRAFRRQAG